MKKIKFFALAAFAMLSINAMAADKTVKYSANGLDYELTYTEATPTNTPKFAAVIGMTTGYTSATSVTIPATIKAEGTGADDAVKGLTFNVTSIADDAFYLKSSVTTVAFSGTNLASIGVRAFQGTKVSTVELPTSVTTIGRGAFKNTLLSTFTWAPTSAATIADSAFVNTKLTTYEIPAKVTALGALNGYVFAESADLATLTLAASSDLATIYGRIIKGTKVTELNLTPALAKLTTIADNAFSSEKLTKVIFAVYAADGTATAQNSAIPATVAAGWFAESYALAEVVLPTHITAIAANAFQNCALTTLDLSHSAGAVTLNNMFNAKATAPYVTLTTVKFPDLAGQTIAGSAFAFCTKLNNIEFPTAWNGDAKVASNAFKGCTGITSVTFEPEAVDGITDGIFAADAFSDCTDFIILTTNKKYSDLAGLIDVAHLKMGSVTPGTAKEITLNNKMALLAQDAAWKVAPDVATVYSLYVDDNTGGEGIIYMVPFQVSGGYYQVSGDNTPVLLKAKENVEKITIYQDAGAANTNWAPVTDNTTVYGSAASAGKLMRSSKTDVQTVTTLVGTTGKYLNVAAINASGVFGFTAPTASTVPAKTYYVLSSKQYGAAGARIVWLDENDDVTAIVGAKKAVKEDGIMYNLAGQKVNASYKGVVIKNGKKYIQK